jgi:putative ABC transport system substrate-binding protein
LGQNAWDCCIANPANPVTELGLKNACVAGFELHLLKASNPDEIDAAFCDLWPRATRRTHGDQRPTLHQSADTDCLVGTSAIYANQEYAEAGGLMTYATSIAEIYHQLGSHTGRILKGEKPADLPVVVQCDCAYRSPRFTS